MTQLLAAISLTLFGCWHLHRYLRKIEGKVPVNHFERLATIAMGTVPVALGLVAWISITMGAVS